MLNLIFSDILLIKRDFYVMILTFIGFLYLEISFSKRIYFFVSRHDLVSSPIFVLPLFSNSHLGQQSSKPLFTYKDVVLPPEINQ